MSSDLKIIDGKCLDIKVWFSYILKVQAKSYVFSNLKNE
jgi:hypothetical protein